MTRQAELEKIFGIYIDLDSLFVTRLGTLGIVDEGLISLALESNYMVRQQDSFPALKKETFKQLYDLRDSETLKISPITSCFKLLNELVFNTLKIAIDSPDCTGVKIFLNIYPYKLTDQEIGDLMDLLVTSTKDKAQIEIISKTPDELTVDYCDNNLVALVMYDYNSWLEANVLNGGFKRKNLTHIMLISPKLYLHKIPTDKEIREVGRKGLTPFKAVTMLASTMIRLELMDINVFSVDLDQYRKAKQQHK